MQAGQAWVARAYAVLALSLGLLGALGLVPVRGPALPCCMSPLLLESLHGWRGT